MALVGMPRLCHLDAANSFLIIIIPFVFWALHNPLDYKMLRAGSVVSFSVQIAAGTGSWRCLLGTTVINVINM